MDRGPFRAQRPTDRKPAPTYRQPEDAHQPSVETPAKTAIPPAHREAVAHRATEAKDHSRAKRSRMPFVIAATVLLLLIGGCFAWTKLGATGGEAIDSSKYQAVFFNNGQVYFGKLHAFTKDSLKLTDIFYLQTQKTTDTTDPANPQKTSTDENNNVQLIKLGNEIHGPEDQMIIQKSQVLFYENLKSDGNVAKSIDKYDTSKK